MFSLLSGAYQYLFEPREYFILILGLDNAGKTVREGVCVCVGGGAWYCVLAMPASPVSLLHCPAAKDHLPPSSTRPLILHPLCCSLMSSPVSSGAVKVHQQAVVFDAAV
jgi:hypothetical protein